MKFSYDSSHEIIVGAFWNSMSWQVLEVTFNEFAINEAQSPYMINEVLVIRGKRRALKSKSVT